MRTRLVTVLAVATTAWLAGPLSVPAPAAPAEERVAPVECTVVGTGGPDELDGTRRADVLCGRGGDDTIDARDRSGRSDIVRCGPGDDRVWADVVDHVARSCERVHQGVAPHAIRLAPGEVAENQPVGTLVGRIVVRDPDAGDEHRVRLVSGKGAADNASFGIEDGSLLTAVPLDFETQPVLRVRVRATDLAGHRIERALRVQVVDEDDSGQCGDCSLHPPVAVDDTVTTVEDTALTVQAGDLVANDTDADGDSLAVVAVADATGGAVTMVGGDVRFAPWTDRCGPAAGRFDYTVSDGKGGQDTGAVTVDITCVYDGPRLAPDSATVAEDSAATTIPVLANDDRGEGGPLTVASVTQPANGTAAAAAGGVTYQPDADFCTSSGPADTFTYTTGSGLTSTVAVTVTCLPDSPVLTFGGSTAAAVEDAAAVAIDPHLSLTDVDVDGEIVWASVQVVDDEAGDVLALSAAHAGIVAVWTAGNSTLTLTGPADVAAFQAALRDVTFATTTVDTGATDRDLLVTVVDDGARAVLAGTTVTVTAVNDAPEITAPTAWNVDENGVRAFAGDVWFSDPDSGSQSLDIVVSAGHGTITLDGVPAPSRSITAPRNQANQLLSSASYTPDADYDGPDTITIEVDDNGHTGTGGDQTDTVTIDVTVDGDNDAPSAASSTFGVIGNTALVVDDPTDGALDPDGLQKTLSADLLAAASDPDDPNSSLSIVPFTDLATSGGGRVTIQADGDFTYLPPAGCTATTDSFSYTVTDNRSVDPQTAVGQVFLNLTGCVWYVDRAVDPAADMDGTSVAPYRTFNGLDGSLGVGDLDRAGDWIFLGSGTYNAFDLEDDQQLYTERSGLVVGGHTLLAPDGDRDRSVINNGLRLAADNTIQGLDLGSSPTYAMFGDAFESLVMNTEMTGDVANGAGGGISLDNGDVDLELAELSANGGAHALYLRDVSGDLSADGGTLSGGSVQIENSPLDLTLGGEVALEGDALSISGSTGGTKDFNGPVSGGSVSLSTNAGTTVRFDGGVDLTTFAATGGGTVAVTGGGNTLDGADATALTVTDTEIDDDGLTFESISSDGAAHGIRLSNVPGGALEVTGNGGSCDQPTDSCTGGVIAGSTDSGVHLDGVGGSVELGEMRIVDSSTAGIWARDVARLEIDGVAVTGSTGPNLRFADDAGSSWLVATDSRFDGSRASVGIAVEPAGTATLSARLQGITMSGNDGSGLAASPTGHADLRISVEGVRVDDPLDVSGPDQAQVDLAVGGHSTTRAFFDDVSLIDSNDSALYVVAAEDAAIDLIVRNSIVRDPAVTGIWVRSRAFSDPRVLIDSTIVRGYNQRGVVLEHGTVNDTGDTPGSASWTLTRSHLFDPGVAAAAGLVLGLFPLGAPTTACADVGGLGVENDLGEAEQPGGADVLVAVMADTTLNFRGLVTDVATTLGMRNTGSPQVVEAGSGSVSGTAVACPQPQLPF